MLSFALRIMQSCTGFAPLIMQDNGLEPVFRFLWI
jgi:hypothetical protein